MAWQDPPQERPPALLTPAGLSLKVSGGPDGAHPRRETRPSQACLPGCYSGHQNLAGLLVNRTLSEPCFLKVACAGDGQMGVDLPGAHSVEEKGHTMMSTKLWALGASWNMTRSGAVLGIREAQGDTVGRRPTGA